MQNYILTQHAYFKNGVPYSTFSYFSSNFIACFSGKESIIKAPNFY